MRNYVNFIDIDIIKGQINNLIQNNEWEYYFNPIGDDYKDSNKLTIVINELPMDKYRISIYNSSRHVEFWIEFSFYSLYNNSAELSHKVAKGFKHAINKLTKETTMEPSTKPKSIRLDKLGKDPDKDVGYELFNHIVEWVREATTLPVYDNLTYLNNHRPYMLYLNNHGKKNVIDGYVHLTVVSLDDNEIKIDASIALRNVNDKLLLQEQVIEFILNHDDKLNPANQ